jgi:hypothetical protein
LICQLLLNVVASAIFYFVVVYFPDYKKKKDILPYVKNQCLSILGDADAILNELNGLSRTRFTIDSITEHELDMLCSRVVLRDPGPIENFENGMFRNGTWFDLLAFRQSRSFASKEKIFAYIMFLDTELIKAITNLSSCSYLSQIEHYKVIISGVRPTTTLNFLSHAMFGYFQEIKKLKCLVDKNQI